MTTEEIKKLSRKYVEEKLSDALKFFPTQLPDSMEVLVKREQERIIKVIEWLSKDYCIVPKSQVIMAHKMEMQEFESTDKPSAAHIFRGRALLLEALFGKELFNKEKKNE